MNQHKIPLITILTVVLLAGCGSTDDDGNPPSGTGDLAFVPDTRQDGASIRLEQKELTDTRLVLDVVAEDVSSLYGLAFRLRIDPEVLALEALEASPAWSSVPQSLAKAQLAPPRTIVGVVTAKGAHSGIDADGTVLATLSLTRKTAAPTAIAFDAVPSAAVAADARKIAGVSWYGGALAPVEAK
jgi:hypothetical protein